MTTTLDSDWQSTDEATTRDDLRVIDLVRAAQAGDRDAFGLLFERYRGAIVAQAMRRVKTADEAEELAQDVFVQAMQKLDQLRVPEAFGGWLRRIEHRMAINRIIVEQPLLEAFTGKFVARVKALPCGDPDHPETVIGPVINARQLAGLQERIASAQSEGATLLAGGPAQGNVLPPHVFGNVTADMAIAREESFGPLVGILAARDADHALELANQTEYGLGAAIGFSMILILFAGLRERIAIADVPTPFRGAAIGMITAGLMSLAFMGFTGLIRL